jgi:hypothetical protein
MHLGNNNITGVQGAQEKIDSSMELVERSGLALVRADSKQFRRGAAEDIPSFLGAQTGRIQDVIDSCGSPGKRPVRPHYNLAGSALGHQMAKKYSLGCFFSGAGRQSAGEVAQP